MIPGMYKDRFVVLAQGEEVQSVKGSGSVGRLKETTR